MPQGLLDSSAMPRGATVGRFVVLEAIGAGAMAVVYKGYDPWLRREVALKFLRARAYERGEAELALVREAQAMAALSHPNVVAVYDVMTRAEHVVLAMEYVRGQTLHQWLAEGGGRRRPWERVLGLFLHAAQGLAAAHRVGLVHRDFKPANVLLSEEGRVLVTDFGIAKQPGVTSRPSGELAEVGCIVDSGLSHDFVLGTPKYMAPEQHSGESVDPRADQYAYCASLWEALCGAAPFGGGTLEALERAKRNGAPSWPQHVRVPRQIIAAIERGLAPHPEHRWPSMQALLDALARPSRSLRKSRVATGVALPMLGAWLWSWQAEHTLRCSGADEVLRGVWDDGRRAAVEAALRGTGVVYAGETWARVSTALDRHVQAWRDHHRLACEATVRDGLQPEAVMDLRMSCLHRRKTELQSVVDVLASADAAVVEKAVQLVSGLPPLDRCSDIDALRAEVPPPEDPGDAARVEQARELLAEATAAERAARYGAALEKLESAAAVLGDVEYAPVDAEIAHRRGAVAYHQGEYERSEEALEQALAVALGWGMQELAAEAAGMLATLIGERQARLSEGLRLAKVGVLLADAVGEERSLQAEGRNNLGIVLYAHGRFEEAEKEYREALALREQQLGLEHPKIADSRTNLGAVLMAQGEFEAAETQLRHAVELFERTLGPEHPRTADCHSNLAVVLHQQGRFEDAEREHRHALGLRERALPPGHPRVGDSHGNLALTLHFRGKLDEAEARHRRALTLFEKAFGPDHPRVADTRANLGMTLHAQARYGEAEVEHRHALRLLEKALGAEHPRVADFRDGLGLLLTAQGRHEEAEVELRRALAHRQGALGAEHPKVADSHNNVGLVLYEQGRHAEAETRLRHALRLYEGFTAPGDARPASARRNLGNVLNELRRPAEAEAELRRALALQQPAFAADHVELGWTHHCLGRVLVSLGRYDEAREHLERAWKIGSPAPGPRGDLAFQLATLLWRREADRVRALQLARQARDAYETAGEGWRGRSRETQQWLAERRL